MPVQDDSGKVVGTIFYEDSASGNYSLCFATVSFSSQVMKLYPAEAEGQADLSNFNVVSEIRCQYITKVGTSSTRPKALNCFEINTTGVIHHFAVDSIEERDEWIEIIKQSSMRQGSFKNVSSKANEQSKGVGYKTQIVGGVIRRIPIQGDLTDDKERDDLTSSGPATVGGATMFDQDNDKEKKPLRKIVKAGYATKCGAVMKSWRRRFFIVTDEFFGYYKSHEETEPIRSVPVSELTAVGKSTVHAAKDHLLEVATPQRVFYIQGDTEEEMQDWIKAFQSVIQMRRTATTLPVTAKERSSSLNNALDPGAVTTPPTPTIQEYDSSPTLTTSRDISQLPNGSGDDDTDDDIVLGSKV